MSATLLCILAAFSVGVSALVERETFDVSVSIPVSEFYVLPVDPGWMGLEQKLEWDIVTSELSPLRKHFDVKNSAGGVAARLNAQPYISNGRDSENIALDVRFNKIKLTVNNAEVISAIDGKAGKRAELMIAAVKPAIGYKPGAYYGSVHLIFEAVAP
ncbi:CS1 type fimbrial major subunit [Pseudomonas sp. EA_5y_Pfl2_R50]|uniref:CS1 type fimbrial major subunit n=1 Tax=Pseudomonas sp. EA_5y_Pfl2_R50 TaxID=3088691 RepID=UPI0030DB7FF4